MGKKNTETAEREEKERGCIFLCAQLNVHDHVRLMKKARQKRQRTDARRKPSLCTVSVLRRQASYSMYSTSVFILLTPAHEGCTPECWQLNKEEPHRNQPVLCAPLCSADPWWSLQVAHKLARNNSRTRAAITSFWLRAPFASAPQSVFTRHEPGLQPPVRSSVSARLVHLSAVRVHCVMKMRIRDKCVLLKIKSGPSGNRGGRGASGRNLHWHLCVRRRVWGWGRVWRCLTTSNSPKPLWRLIHTHSRVLPWWLGLAMLLDSRGSQFMLIHVVFMCACCVLPLENIPVACGFGWASDISQLYLRLLSQFFITVYISWNWL